MNLNCPDISILPCDATCKWGADGQLANNFLCMVNKYSSDYLLTLFSWIYYANYTENINYYSVQLFVYILCQIVLTMSAYLSSEGPFIWISYSMQCQLIIKACIIPLQCYLMMNSYSLVFFVFEKIWWKIFFNINRLLFLVQMVKDFLLYYVQEAVSWPSKFF